MCYAYVKGSRVLFPLVSDTIFSSLIQVYRIILTMHACGKKETLAYALTHPMFSVKSILCCYLNREVKASNYMLAIVRRK